MLFHYIKKQLFKKTILKEFLEQTHLYKDKKEAIVLFFESIDGFYIFQIINEKSILIKNDKNSFKVININLIENFELSTELMILIKDSKKNAQILKNNHLIEYYSNLLNNIKHKYKLGFKEINLIWDNLLKMDKDFFSDNHMPKILENNQSWVD